MQKGREQEAESFLTQIVGPQEAPAEIAAIRSAIAEESGDLLDPTFRKALIVAILIALFSQFTGINTIIYYGSIVFLEHVPHQTASTALWANVIIGAINFVATIAGMQLIDRTGRKSILMSAFAGMALSLGRFHFHSFSGLRPYRSDLCPHLRGMFCSRRRHRDVGSHGGNLPHEGKGPGDVCRHGLSVVWNAPGNTDFSFASDRVHRSWSFLALRSCLHRGVPFCLAASSRDQGQDPRRDRKILVGSEDSTRIIQNEHPFSFHSVRHPRDVGNADPFLMGDL